MAGVKGGSLLVVAELVPRSACDLSAGLSTGDEWYVVLEYISYYLFLICNYYVGIMEAYWNLSAKRFVDHVCMCCDADLLGALPEAVQDSLFAFIKDDARLQVTHILIATE